MGKKKGAGGVGPGPQQAREDSSASAAHDSIQTLTERVEQLEARLLQHEARNGEEQKSPEIEGAVKQQARHSPPPVASAQSTNTPSAQSWHRVTNLSMSIDLSQSCVFALGGRWPTLKSG